MRNVPQVTPYVCRDRTNIIKAYVSDRYDLHVITLRLLNNILKVRMMNVGTFLLTSDSDKNIVKLNKMSLKLTGERKGCFLGIVCKLKLPNVLSSAQPVQLCF